MYIASSVNDLHHLYKVEIVKTVWTLLDDSSHPLFSEFCCHRLAEDRTHKDAGIDLFISAAICLINDSLWLICIVDLLIVIYVHWPHVITAGCTINCSSGIQKILWSLIMYVVSIKRQIAMNKLPSLYSDILPRCFGLTLERRRRTRLSRSVDSRTELPQLFSLDAELNHVLQFHLIRTVHHVLVILEHSGDYDL